MSVGKSEASTGETFIMKPQKHEENPIPGIMNDILKGRRKLKKSLIWKDIATRQTKGS